MYRTKDFDKHLSKQLQNPSYRKGYLLSLIKDDNGEEGLSLFDSLKHVISKMGVTDFANLTDMERSSISRLLSQDSPPKLETLNRLLIPFGLKVKIDLEEVA